MVEAKRKKYGLLKDLVVTGESCLVDWRRFHFLQIGRLRVKLWSIGYGYKMRFLVTDLNQLDAKERQSGKHIMRHLSLASEAYNITLSVDGINAALYKEKASNIFFK